MNQRNFTIKSECDGLDLDITVFEPEDEIKGVFQISHGMAEHKERYYRFMEYLTQNGYRVKYRMDYRKIPQIILVVIVLIIIGVIIWVLPVTHNYLVQFYEENIIIHKIVDIILNL